MKISIFTTMTNPAKRQDLLAPSLKSYSGAADEVILVAGGEVSEDMAGDKIKIVSHKWPDEFHWSFISEQFQRGYDNATGDWVIHMDSDFIFHEDDYQAIREACERHNDAPAMSFYKWQFILPDRYNLKSRLIIAVNKGKFGDRIKFNSGGDLAQPSLDGKYLGPDDVPQAEIRFFNYEKILKTKEQVLDDCGKMDRAWHRQFNEYQLSQDGTNASAFDGWLEMVIGRISKPNERIPLSRHPKVMQETIKNLRPDQWGYSGWGLLEVNDYAKN